MRGGQVTARRVLVAFALGIGLVATPTAAAPAPTPDEQLVAGLEIAQRGARAAVRSLTRPSAGRVTKARAQVLQAIQGLNSAARAAPRAIGALETPSVRTALQDARRVGHQARTDIARGRYAAGRASLRQAIALTSGALADFGVPLEKEFPSFAVNRDFGYLPEFAGYSGLSATVGSDISEVVIGAANRTTANAGEPGPAVGESAGLPITKMSVAVISDEIGRFTSGWCELASGVITCRIRPAMPADRIFTIAFGPKLPRGTKLLVKFRSAAGDRSYAVFTTR